MASIFQSLLSIYPKIRRLNHHKLLAVVYKWDQKGRLFVSIVILFLFQGGGIHNCMLWHKNAHILGDF